MTDLPFYLSINVESCEVKNLGKKVEKTEIPGDFAGLVSVLLIFKADDDNRLLGDLTSLIVMQQVIYSLV